MVFRMKYMIVLTGYFLVSHVYGQQSLSYQVLIAENVSINNLVISQFDHLWPGDTVHIGASGYLALISSNFHSIEIPHDSVLVIPDLGTEDFEKEYSRPDLRGLFAVQDIGSSNSYGAVALGMSSLKLVYPTIRYSLSSTHINSIPIVWNDHTDAHDTKEKLEIMISSLYAEDLVTFEIDSNSFCLNVEEYPAARDVLLHDSAILVQLERDHQRQTFSITLSDNDLWHPPFDVCEITNPVMAVAFALFLEYNRKNLKDPAKPYYLLATQLSRNPQYRKIYENSLNR